MMKDPDDSPSLMKPHCCCIRQRVTPTTIPIRAPKPAIIHPSNRKIRRINRLSAPILRSVTASSRFSIISMEREPTTLKRAMVRMKQRIRKVIHFSTCIILKEACCCSYRSSTRKSSPKRVRICCFVAERSASAFNFSSKADTSWE